MNDIEIAFNMGYRVKNGISYGLLNNNVRVINVKKDYERFSVTVGSRTDNSRRVYSIYVHRLVAYQKYGIDMFADGIEVRHKDGNTLNNLDENVIIGTKSENQMDISPIKRMDRAVNASTIVRKFSDKTIKEIRRKHFFGATYKELMYEYNISSKGTMSYIINNDYTTKR